LSLETEKTNVKLNDDDNIKTKESSPTTTLKFVKRVNNKYQINSKTNLYIRGLSETATDL
jgi:hypothetical protein